jgi:hypothetical protein
MDDNHFEIESHGVIMKVERLSLPGHVAFRVVFSSARKPLVVARATNADAAKFWTSIPEGRQTFLFLFHKFFHRHFPFITQSS